MSKQQATLSPYYCLMVALQCQHTLAFSTSRHYQWQREASTFFQNGSGLSYLLDAFAIMDFLRFTQHRPSPYPTTTALSFSAAIGALGPPSGSLTSQAHLSAPNPTYDGVQRRLPTLCRLPQALLSQRLRAHKKKLLRITTHAWEHPRCPLSPRPSTA
jgi:hypothetical protein